MINCESDALLPPQIGKTDAFAFSPRWEERESVDDLKFGTFHAHNPFKKHAHD